VIGSIPIRERNENDVLLAGQARSICRELIMPFEYATRITLSRILGWMAVAPVSSFL
jgi:hypothetical protein